METSVKENASITVLRNPFSGLFRVELPSGFYAERYQVISPAGNIVLQNNKPGGTNPIKLNLFAAAKGVYLFVMYDTNGNKRITRLVLQ